MTGRHGDTDRKSREAYVQHHGPIVGRVKFWLSKVMG